MSASYGILQRLVHPHGSRVIQHSKILPFNNRGRGRGGRRRGRRYRCRGYGHGHGRGRGGKGGRGGRRYGYKSYEFASRYGTFLAEAFVYPADQWRLLSLQQNINFQEMKIFQEWRGFEVPPEKYKLDNEEKPIICTQPQPSNKPNELIW